MVKVKKEDGVVLDAKSIQKFDPTVAELNKLVDKTKDLVATDLKDKAQLELVRSSRIELKKKRVQIEKYGKSLRDEANKFNKAVLEKEKELIGIIEPEEDRLEKIEEEAEKLAIREERMTKLPSRKARLESIGDGVDVADDDLLQMDSNDFEAYFNARTLDKLNADKAAAEAKQKEEDEKRRLDNEAKQAELKKEQDKIDAQKREIEAEKQRLENEKLAREREEKARQEERDRIDRENKAKAEKEAAEKAKMERAERYKAYRASIGWTKETAGEWKEEVKDGVVTLYKKVGEFKLEI